MNKNSLCYWWPKIKTLGIPVPKTEIAGFNDSPQDIDYPLFLRTDLCSGKHDWNKSCFVQSADVLAERVENVVLNNAAWKMLGQEPTALIFREFLELDSTFTAFTGRMPITRERRYFINAGEVICHHPYWPVTAFDRHPARLAYDNNWKDKLAELNKEGDEVDILKGYCQRVGRVMPEYWSIDFARGKNGLWYLLDMALGENSFHWEGCKQKL